jgi:hydroxymethylglutaryl-CoA lyase
MTDKVYITECPRDAMQGWPHFIATESKVRYIQQLLQVGFDTLDCVSFVSPKAIPQMADSHEVMRQLDKGNSHTKLLAIVLNERGAADALQYDAIDVLGFPFSISASFQQRNGNSSIEENWERLQRIQELTAATHQSLLVYISMGYGNPYGDAYNPEIVQEWISRMKTIGIQQIALADTVGVADATLVQTVTAAAIEAFPDMQIGVHLHSSTQNLQPKLQAAWQAGSRRFDGALKGFGGCPMANDDLVGNMPTEAIVAFAQQQSRYPINEAALQEALAMSASIFV